MNKHRGSTLMGFIVGVVVGLALALVVAVYVTKVPIPMLHESPSRTADQDASESRKNKDWDPNAPLYGKNPARPVSAAAVPELPASAASGAPAKPAAAASAAAKVSADPLGDLAKQKAAATVDGNVYFIQVGAFNSQQDADAQRAKLSLSGVEAVVTERDQSGRVVYRVRSGPHNTREEADKVKERIEGAGFDAALVALKR
jgi:cell division protein FtsN